MKKIAFAAGIIFSALLCGCGPQGNMFTRVVPAEIDLGDAKVLVVEKADADEGALKVIDAAVTRAIAGSGWWVTGKDDAKNAATVKLENVKSIIDTSVRETEDGSEQVYVARVSFDAICEGKIMGCSGESVLGIKKENVDEGLKVAADEAVSQLFSKITPSEDMFSMRLDTAAADMKNIEDLVRKGSNAEALAEIEDVLSKDSDRIDALYNKAVITDLQGDYALALAMFDKVLKKAPASKSFYSEARAECARHYLGR